MSVVLDIFETEHTLDSNRQKSDAFTQALQEVVEHPRVQNFRHLGMIWAFEVIPHAPDFAGRFQQAALRHAVFIRPIGNTVYLMPPYVVDESEMQLLAKTLLYCLNDSAL